MPLLRCRWVLFYHYQWHPEILYVHVNVVVVFFLIAKNKVKVTANLQSAPRTCRSSRYLYWCLATPIPLFIIVVFGVSFMGKCSPVNTDVTVEIRSNDTVKAGEFGSCNSLVLQTSSTTAIKVAVLDCSSLTLDSELISTSKSFYNTNNTRFMVYDSSESSSYFANGVLSETKLNIITNEAGRGTFCHFTSHSHLQGFSDPEASSGTDLSDCLSFYINSTSENTYTFTFNSNQSTYLFVSFSIPGLLISSLYFTFTAERSYYNMSDLSFPIDCQAKQCNIPLPFSPTCVLIHSEGEGVFHQLPLSSVQDLGKARPIAVVVFILLVLLYLLYLYVMVCARYVWTK